MSTHHLTLIVPVKNEPENILLFYNNLLKNCKLKTLIIFSVDHDGDQSIGEIKKLSAQNPYDVFLQINPDSKGPSDAIKKCISSVHTDFFAVMMIDGSDQAQDLEKMYTHISQKNLSLVSASRFAPNGRHLGKDLTKKYFAQCSSYLLNNLFHIGTSDLTNNFKLYRTSDVQQLVIQADRYFNFALEVTLKIKFAHKKIDEIPTTWHERQRGKSHFKFYRSILSYFITVFRCLGDRYIKENNE